jgi:16S rRNA (cytosine967-C5)-methyltransferase
VGNIKQLPGFNDGWYSVQDSSAQLVSHFLNPQPRETIIDACAAPGGKTTHIAELIGDQGLIYGWDSNSKRLQKLQENVSRLQLNSIKIETVDASKSNIFNHQADKVLVDAPCSGLGTLHKRPDIRWRQNPEKIEELSQLQTKILNNASKGVKEGGKLVYATCTLNPLENEEIIRNFLQTHPDWQIEIPPDSFRQNFLVTPEGMIKVFPHRNQMDGFFMVKLYCQ